MKKSFLALAIFLFVGIISIYAVPAYPYLMTRVQPDGTAINFYLKGDCGAFGYATTEDGYLLLENSDGVFEYAVLDQNNLISSTGVKAYNQAERSVQEKLYVKALTSAADLHDTLHEAVHAANSALVDCTHDDATLSKAPAFSVASGYPLFGSPKSVVILVSFSDNDFSLSDAEAKTKFQRLVSEDGYSDNSATSSAREYFRASSFEQFDPDFVVVGPYKLDNPMEYYGAATSSQNDANAAQMIIDACLKAEDDGVDFTEYDTDGDNKVDNVFVFYAGYNQAEGASSNTIWPHRSTLSTSVTVSGMSLGNYSCTSELRGSSGSTICGIGTFSHEFGHVLGLPDFYDTGYGTHATLETWDIMDQGPYNNQGRTPPVYSAHERFYLGWMYPTDLTPGTHTLESIESSNTAYIIRTDVADLTDSYHSKAREYFLLENRQQEDLDSFVPGEGMLVTHVVYNASTWSINQPNNDPDNMGVSIYCASGTTESPARNTYPGTKSVTTCQITFKDGTDLADPITSIKEEKGVISFLYADGPSIVTKDPIEEMIMYQGSEPLTQLIEFYGSQLDDEVTLKINSGKYFAMREYTEDGSNEYGKTLTVMPDAVDSTFSLVVELKFDPDTYISYDSYIEDKIVATSTATADDGSDIDVSLSFTLLAKSLRAITVVPPTAYDPINVTPWAITACWSSVDDATAYYLSVFSIEDIDYSEAEEFSTFDSEMPTGWSSTFTTTNTVYKGSSPKSVSFTELTDTIWTEEYFMDASSISFWLYSDNSTGQFYVDALVDDVWTNICSKEISNTVRNETVTIDLDGISTSQFRIYYANEGANSLLFDDFTAYFPQKINYVLDNYEIVATELDTMTAGVAGMTPELEYIYNVKATDKDEDGLYNNVTEASNDIYVTLPYGEESGAKAMTISYDESTGVYSAYVEKYYSDYSIYVYSMEGRLMAVLPAETDKKIEIPTLPNNNVYILKYSSNTGIKRADVVGKFFYK